MEPGNELGCMPNSGHVASHVPIVGCLLFLMKKILQAAY